MGVAHAFEIFYGVFFFIHGVSFITAAHQWKKLVVIWVEQPEQYAIVALMMLPLGLFTILFHNIWTGSAIIVSLLGWLLTIKACAILCFPSLLYRLSNKLLVYQKIFTLSAIFYIFLGVLILVMAYQ